MITAQPITYEERPRCACCNKGLLPRFPEQLTWKTEEEFAAATTKRRVYSIRRQYLKRYSEDLNTYTRGELYRIEASLFPTNRAAWGADGLFCTNTCAQHFAHAAYAAGYRGRK